MSSFASPNPAPDWPNPGDEVVKASFGPFDAERLAAYAEASGDDNPIHLDAMVARGVGLEAPPVHGMLLMACFELALRAWRGDVRVARLSAKFLTPVLAGQSIAVTGRVVRAAAGERPEIVLRLVARAPDNALAIVAEAALVPAGARPA